MKKVCSPQEKKRLSYQKDRRNTYGERGSHSRHAIAAHKTSDRRAYRHRANQILNGTEGTQAELLEEIDIAVKSVAASHWRKCPDRPLGKFVEHQQRRRVALGINVTAKKILK
ncbi:MAG: hypothetical protein JO360_09090 [Acidobacteria bacterium]|nr:hypothetical protein [Acidobacteriota bacterium]